MRPRVTEARTQSAGHRRFQLPPPVGRIPRSLIGLPRQRQDPDTHSSMVAFSTTPRLGAQIHGLGGLTAPLDVQGSCV